LSVNTLLCKPHVSCSFGQLHSEQNCDPKIALVADRKLFAGRFVFRPIIFVAIKTVYQIDL